MRVPSFKDCIAADVSNVFLNTGEFAGERTIRYDGAEYKDVAVSIQELEELDRLRTSSAGAGGSRPDSAQGLRQISAILYCAEASLDGQVPEQGKSIAISDKKGGSWFDKYEIASAGAEMGMLRVELRAVTE